MPEAPTLEEVLLQVFDQNAGELKAIQPGEVIAWDKDEQFATIQPLVRERTGVNRAVIYRVPVIQPTAYHDVQIGETGLLLICDRNPARWWRDNQQSNAETEATHHLSNAIFIPGLRSKADARTIQSNSSVLEKPVAGGTVRLGVQNATKAVVHEDFQTELNTFLGILSTWALALVVPTGVPDTITAAATTLADAVYTSPSVKVED